MQNALDIENALSKHKESLLLHNLAVKETRTTEEEELYETLLLKQLAMLEKNKQNRQDVIQSEQKSETETSSSDGMEQDALFEPTIGQEPDDVVRKPRTIPTVAAQMNNHTKPGAVKIKQKMNDSYPEDKVGSQHTPVKVVGKDITNSRFFASPGGTTVTYEHTVKVSVKKVSGGQFVEPDTDDKTEQSANNTFG